MADKTKIEWADDTLNLWIGCTQISAACDHCYAKEIAERFKLVEAWNAPPRRTSEASWSAIERYQRGAKRFRAEHGRQRRVFVNSMSDIGDNQADPAWLTAACARFEAADDVVWMFVTKRPEILRKRLPSHWFRPNGWPPHIWVIVTTETAKDFDHRVPLLMDLPAPVRGVSMEPLLEAFDVRWAFNRSPTDIMRQISMRLPRRALPQHIRGLEWAIIGGESGRGARSMPQGWEMTDMVAGIRGGTGAVFFKQLSQADEPGRVRVGDKTIAAYKDFATFPHALQHREHPNHAR